MVGGGPRVGGMLKAGAGAPPLARLAALTAPPPSTFGLASDRRRGMAGLAPLAAIAQDGVEDGEELADAGGERELGRLATADEALVEGLDRGLAPDRGQGRHVGGGADSAAAAREDPAAAEGAAVAVDPG